MDEGSLDAQKYIGKFVMGWSNPSGRRSRRAYGLCVLPSTGTLGMGSGGQLSRL